MSVVATSHAGRDGIRVHIVRGLEPAERTTLEGLRVTAPARTLLDLAAVTDPAELERAAARAEREGLLGARNLAAVVERYRGRAGVRALRSLLRDGVGPALTRSEAEARFLELVRAARLPPPECNVRLGGYEIDFLWRSAGLAVEVDGHRYHASRSRFEDDRRRGVRLAAQGVHVLRVTWRQIAEDGVATAVLLGQALVRAGAR